VLVKPGKKCKIGKRLVVGDKLSLVVDGITDSGERIVRFYYDGVFEQILDEVGSMPLPPYIKEKLRDKNRYQTVYAKTEGSAAAPTAGLHFTPELMQKIRDMGVEIVEVLLHVGLGTFRPVKEDVITDHKMHEEYYEVSPASAKIINDAKAQGRRIIAVGTTSVRTLESASNDDGTIRAESGNTSIFIYPPYKFKCVNALITNFHLPESTLIMLVSALSSREKTLEIYNTAVSEQYRFFSFGDACLIL
jgi:S-adenosylmethionine:tRNA ribosyltransferase-isomerase